jgi:hypothetical protein
VLLTASLVSSLFLVVEVKVDVRSLAQTYHRKREESRDAHRQDAWTPGTPSQTQAHMKSQFADSSSIFGDLGVLAVSPF